MPAAAVSDPPLTNGTLQDPNSIAVIGLACRFPGDASNPERFWDMLCEGRCECWIQFPLLEYRLY